MKKNGDMAFLTDPKTSGPTEPLLTARAQAEDE